MKYLLLFSFFISLQLHAQYSMRRCMILPIIDDARVAIGYDVFKNIENFLLDSSWCYYQHNSGILNILDSYQRNLKKHLNNKDVLRVIAEKSRVGSLIKIELSSYGTGVKIHLQVIGENGTDIYLNEETSLVAVNVDIIAQTIRNWLSTYENNIPYNALIVGVLGDQFSIDSGKQSGFLEGDRIRILRLEGKKVHPLLKEIVDWKYKKIGSGKIIFTNQSQSQGKVIQYDGPIKLQIGDWVVLDRDKNRDQKLVKSVNDPKKYEFGKIGTVSILSNVSSGNIVSKYNSSDSKKIAGWLFGVKAVTDVWITRNYWVQAGLRYDFGKFSKVSSSVINESNSPTISMYKILVGYRYLPLGFFYGPQINMYMGYIKNNYSFEFQSDDGITDYSMSGLLLGLNGDMPIHKKVRLNMQIDFIFNPTYHEDLRLYGKSKSTTSFHVAMTATYNYSPSMVIDLLVDLNSNAAKFLNENEINFKETSVSIGPKFNF